MKIIDDTFLKIDMVEDLSDRFLKYVSALNTMPEKYAESNDSASLSITVELIYFLYQER